MCLLLLVAGKQPFWAAAADKKKYLSALRRMTADIEFEVRINRVSVCERQRELGAAACRRRMTADIEFEVRINRVSVCERQRELGAAACRNWERQLAAAGESRT